MPSVQDTVKTFAVATALAVAVLGLPGTAAAHVIVSPMDSAAGATQLYMVAVPSEKRVDTVKVELQFPRTLVVLQLQAPAGFAVTAEKDGSGRILGAVWEGGATHADEFAAFGVLAQNPSGSADLAWTAIQTYADGSEVQWVGPETSQFPATVTRVRSTGLEDWLSVALGATALIVSLAALAFTFAGWRRGRAPEARARVNPYTPGAVTGVEKPSG